MSLGPVRSRRRWSSGGRARVVALLLAVQGLGSLHLVLVPHSRCAEHGELVEGARPVAALAEAAAHARVEVTGGRAATTDDHDEHCALCSLRAPSPGGVRVASLAPLAAPRARAPEGTERPKTSIPVVAIAPKSSPPSRAAV